MCLTRAVLTASGRAGVWREPGCGAGTEPEVCDAAARSDAADGGARPPYPLEQTAHIAAQLRSREEAFAGRAHHPTVPATPEVRRFFLLHVFDPCPLAILLCSDYWKLTDRVAACFTKGVEMQSCRGEFLLRPMTYQMPRWIADHLRSAIHHTNILSIRHDTRQIMTFV